jgi:hypothetical protein
MVFFIMGPSGVGHWASGEKKRKNATLGWPSAFFSPRLVLILTPDARRQTPDEIPFGGPSHA